ncbi:alpha/beta fold hydrolase [Cohnella luojiensis]|uniref:Alpha/beta fold hydrolase n=1 Tax=Cohnella luojiensis TaxID=652876 RepID=A0A4Y8LQA5_9BACL|nr:alpha/beta fold hydrolase [Cohnella luojiensis]TFE23483.1 alpha/beta fold hydrolase [Cohnella luojiensis]
MNKSSKEGIYFTRTREMKLYYRLWKPVHPQALLIFVHGAGEHSGQYSHLGIECLHRNIALIAPDLRGFGKSEGKRGYIRQFKDYLDDLNELVIYLQIQFSELPIYLFGYSLGGLVAIRYAQQFCDKVTGVILSSPALGIRLKVPYFIKKPIEFISLIAPALPLELVKWNESLRKLKWLQSSLPDWTSEMLKDPYATIRYTPRWFTELLHNGTKALLEVNQFHSPILCLYDRYDSIVNSDLIEQFIGNVASEDKECFVFAKGNHQFLHDGEALRHIFQWLRSRL